MAFLVAFSVSCHLSKDRSSKQCGNTLVENHSYILSLALVGNRFRGLVSNPTFLEALLHISDM